MIYDVNNKMSKKNLIVDPKDNLRQKISSLVEIISIKTFPNFLEVIGHQNLKVQLDKKQCSSWIYEKLQSCGAIIHDKENPCIIKKACKNQVERNGAVNAHIKDGIAVCRFLAWFDKTIKENELCELDVAKKIYETQKIRKHEKYKI